MPAKRTSIFALAAVMLGCCGCADRQNPASSPVISETQASREVAYRYDDPRLTDDERRAVRGATEAVLDPSRPRPDFDQAFRYTIGKFDGEWSVIVWRVYGFKNGEPQFAPGAHTFVRLDPNFKVKSIMPGA